jgi:hypothetical protein
MGRLDELWQPKWWARWVVIPLFGEHSDYVLRAGKQFFDSSSERARTDCLAENDDGRYAVAFADGDELLFALLHSAARFSDAAGGVYWSLFVALPRRLQSGYEVINECARQSWCDPAGGSLPSK